MPLGYPCPLSDEDCAGLNAVLQSAHGTAEMCKDASECGLPTEEQSHANGMQQQLAQRLKAKYFPYSP